jgi:hypothetical protein
VERLIHHSMRNTGTVDVSMRLPKRVSSASPEASTRFGDKDDGFEIVFTWLMEKINGLVLRL